MAAKLAGLLAFGDTTVSVRLVALGERCPDFEGPLPYQIRSPVSVEVFRVFVAALEGALPAITTENMNDLLLLSEEFGFASLLSQVTEYISAHTVVDYEARKRISDLEAKNRQQTRKYCLLQKEAVDLREANKAQKEEILSLGRAQAKSDKEMSELRAQFAREQGATKREIAALGRQLGEEAAARGKFAQELGSLKSQFAEERRKWDEANKQNMREHASLRKQNPAPPPAAQGKPAPASPANPAPPPKPPTAPRTQFPFTSDPPKSGKMPAGGVIAHLTAKYGGNLHDNGAVEITASSVGHSDCTPRNAADLGNKDSYFCSDDKPGQWISWDFKALRIEPTHYTIQTYDGDPNYYHLKSWVVEGSDDGTSWTEIDRRKNNSNLTAKLAVKTFAVVRSGSFCRIRLRQNGRNHSRNNCLILTAFEVFGAVAGLQ
jgi:hypothetical protein